MGCAKDGKEPGTLGWLALKMALVNSNLLGKSRYCYDEDATKVVRANAGGKSAKGLRRHDEVKKVVQNADLN